MFAIELPLGENLVPAPVMERKKPKHKLSIALVKDNRIVLTVMTVTLELTGHDVIAVDSGRKLSGACKGCQPAIVLMDYRLADGETGLNVIFVARELFGRSLPVLVISGETATELMRKMADRGVKVVHKLVELSDLTTRSLYMTTEYNHSDGLVDAQRALLEAKDLDAIVKIAKQAALYGKANDSQ